MKKVKAYSRKKLLSDLINGKIQLKDIPKRIRIKSTVYYSFAIRHYEYCQDIDSPFEVMYNDINSISDVALKESLIDTYNIYGKSKGLVYGKDDTKVEVVEVQRE